MFHDSLNNPYHVIAPYVIVGMEESKKTVMAFAVELKSVVPAHVHAGILCAKVREWGVKNLLPRWRAWLLINSGRR